MCTALTYKTEDLYFGRTLDYHTSYGEKITVTPRGFDLSLPRSEEASGNYAIIGVSHVSEGYPLYYDAINEKGLCAAGLNFVGNAIYGTGGGKAFDIPQYKLIPWLLRRCASLEEALRLLSLTNITEEPFSPSLPCARLHWILADKSGAVTVEATCEGLCIYRNPVGVLTNNPPFKEQLFRLNDYTKLSTRDPVNCFSSKLSPNIYSRGMGALGLPGDLSSVSRFVRASFMKLNSVSSADEAESVGQFFHILGTVEQPRGCCDVGDGYEITIYTSCCNADKGIYYYTTYGNRQINAVSLNSEDLDSSALITYPLIEKEAINYQN